MRKSAIGIWILAFVVGCGDSEGSKADDLAEELLGPIREKLVDCEGRIFARVWEDRKGMGAAFHYYELKNPKFYSENFLSEVDKANGLEWNGEVLVQVDMYRWCGRNTDACVGEWQDRYRRFINFTATRKNGQWDRVDDGRIREMDQTCGILLKM